MITRTKLTHGMTLAAVSALGLKHHRVAPGVYQNDVLRTLDEGGIAPGEPDSELLAARMLAQALLSRGDYQPAYVFESWTITDLHEWNRAFTGSFFTDPRDFLVNLLLVGVQGKAPHEELQAVFRPNEGAAGSSRVTLRRNEIVSYSTRQLPPPRLRRSSPGSTGFSLLRWATLAV